MQTSRKDVYDFFIKTGFNTLPNDLGNTTSDFSQPNYTLNQKAKVANKLTRQPKKRFIKRFKKLKKD